MRLFFTAIFAALVLASLVAWRTTPKPVTDGRTPLIWVSDDNPMRREQIEPFNRRHPEYDLRLDPTNGTMEKVIVQSLGGVGPDLFDCYGPSELAAYVRSGVAWDVTDELAKLGIDVLNETWSAVHPCSVLNGRVYGLPTNAAVNGLWFHKDLFDEAGLPYPSGPMTWDQLVELARKLTVRDRDGRVVRYGFICDWNVDYYQFIYQAGGRFYTPDGARCVVDSPEAIRGVEFMRDLIFKHKVAPGFAEEQAMSSQGGWGAGPITLFGAKRAAMALGGRWWLCTLRNYKGLRLGAAEAPHGPHRVFRGYGKATLINASSPRRQEALDFFRYMYSKEYNDVINRQADGIGPVIRHADGPDFLHNPDHPEEDYNAVWRDMQRLAIPDTVSPFINGALMGRITANQFDLIRGGQKAPADALRTIANLVNAEIEANVRKDPDLRELYDKLRAESAGPHDQ